MIYQTSKLHLLTNQHNSTKKGVWEFRLIFQLQLTVMHYFMYFAELYNNSWMPMYNIFLSIQIIFLTKTGNKELKFTKSNILWPWLLSATSTGLCLNCCNSLPVTERINVFFRWCFSKEKHGDEKTVLIYESRSMSWV